MVDEFSAFARMPAPVMSEVSLQELIEQAVFLQRSAGYGLTYETTLPEAPIRIACDGRQIGRVLTNLLLNAAESIEARLAVEGDSAASGHIEVRLEAAAEGLVIERFYDVDPAKIGRTLRGAPIDSWEALDPPGRLPLVAAVGAAGARALIRPQVLERGYREGVDFVFAA